MKKIFLTLIVLAAASTAAFAQYKFTEAYDLTLVSKLMDTPNPYHRVDTVKYKGFTKGENDQVRCPAGMSVAFRINSKSIVVKTEYGTYQSKALNTMPMSYRGYDLYIRAEKLPNGREASNSSEWTWAGCKVAGFNEKSNEAVEIVANMDGQMHECLLYLPIYSEVYSVQIGVEESAVIEKIDNPFRHRVAIFGSSYTHGISTSRAGMSYPDQFMRHTGIQLLTLGCSGNCKMQDYFAAVLADVDADAFIFDAFSNPKAPMIEERLFPFIEKMQAAHPGKPLIFQQSIYREIRNFNSAMEKQEADKLAMAEKLMKEACKKYKDVYFIHPNASVPSHESEVDGTHPDDYGYYLWARSIEKPVLKILRRYGLR